MSDDDNVIDAQTEFDPPNLIRCELDKAVKEAENEEEEKENIERELSKLELLAGPNWRDAFK